MQWFQLKKLRSALASAHDVGDFGEMRRTVARLDGYAEEGWNQYIGRIWQRWPLLRTGVLLMPIVSELAYALYFISGFGLSIVLACAPVAAVLLAAFNYDVGGYFGAVAKGGGAAVNHKEPGADTADNANDVDALLGGGEEDARWCSLCKRERRQFEAHCLTCGGCVPGQDHHCGLLNVCVGDANRAAYIVFLCTCMLGSLPQALHMARWALWNLLPLIFFQTTPYGTAAVFWFVPLMWAVSSPIGMLLFLVQQGAYLAYRRGWLLQPL
jgi:hypothetical protein